MAGASGQLDTVEPPPRRWTPLKCCVQPFLRSWASTWVEDPTVEYVRGSEFAGSSGRPDCRNKVPPRSLTYPDALAVHHRARMSAQTDSQKRGRFKTRSADTNARRQFIHCSSRTVSAAPVSSSLGTTFSTIPKTKAFLLVNPRGCF
jgi:hypothetical protein